MNRHLSSAEISDWVIGEKTPDQERHARECAECSAEIKRLERVFLMFRESGQRWADHWHVYRDTLPAAGLRSSRLNWLGFASALATLAIVGVLLLLSPAPHRPSEQAFVRVPYVVPPAPYERTEVMRMEVPVATLLAAGLEVHVSAVEGTVRADVLVGQDGRALAIRLVPKF